MEEDIKDYIESINEIRREFEICKMQMNLRKAKKAKAVSFLKDEDQKNAALQSGDELLLIYQGEWKKPQTKRTNNIQNNRNTCDIHSRRPLDLYCFLELKAVCEKCVIEEHMNH